VVCSFPVGHPARPSWMKIGPTARSPGRFDAPTLFYNGLPVGLGLFIYLCVFYVVSVARKGLERSGRGLIEVLSQHLPEGTEKN
jgi:hypothetical protein